MLMWSSIIVFEILLLSCPIINIYPMLTAKQHFTQRRKASCAKYSLGTPTKYHLFTNEFLQEKGIYTKKLHHLGVQKLLSKKLQRSGFMSFKKFTGVQKGQKLGLDSLLLNFETLMWIFEWQVIKYEISGRKIRFFHILCKIFKNALKLPKNA